MKTTNIFLKPLVLAVFFATSLFFASCSSDDNNKSGVNHSEKIIGTWEYYQIGGVIDGEEHLDSPFVDETGCGLPYVIFQTNGHQTTGFPFYSTEEGMCLTEMTYDNWTINNENLIVAEEVWEILQLDDTTLKLGLKEGNDVLILVLKKI